MRYRRALAINHVTRAGFGRAVSAGAALRPNPAFERTRRGSPSTWRLSGRRAAQLVVGAHGVEGLAFLACCSWRRCQCRSCISHVMRLRSLNAPNFVGRASVNAAVRRLVAKFHSPRFARNVSQRCGNMRRAIMKVRAQVGETSWRALSPRPCYQSRYPRRLRSSGQRRCRPAPQPGVRADAPGKSFNLAIVGAARRSTCRWGSWR
jgi:hypothetical protein